MVESRSESRDRWKCSLWTDKEGDNGKGKMAIGEKKVLIAKVKNLIILPESQ